MKRTTGYNIGLAIWRLKCFYETFVQGSSAVILLNFCAKLKIGCFDCPTIAKPRTVMPHCKKTADRTFKHI